MFQDDILEIYNSLVVFNDVVIKKPSPKPIFVKYDPESTHLIFTTEGITVRLNNIIFYSLALETISDGTYLLPEDYDSLMGSLQYMIKSGELIKEKTLLSPENFGFDIYCVNYKEYKKGLQFFAGARFISGNSWWFKLKTKLKYNL